MVHKSGARTYVMAYWPIPGNAKRSLDHYSEHLALSLQMLAGENLYFISGNKAVLSSVEALSKAHGVRLHVARRTLDDLPKRTAMDTLLQKTKEFGSRLSAPPADFQRDKGLIHYWRDYRQSGEEAFKRIFCIWHSKIDLLQAAARDNPFSSSEFAWVDASISRFNGRRPGWDFRRLPAARPGVVQHYANDMCKNGRQLALNASFLLCDAAAIDRLHAAYEEAFALCLRDAYPNDEETVLDTIVTRNPELFSVISDHPVSHPGSALRSSAGPSQSDRAASQPRKILVVGTFRSGTNAMKACLETYFDVEVTFNDWFWKHGVPPTGIQCPVPDGVPIIVMVKSPYAFHESLYPFWQHRRPNLDSGENVSAFARKELIVFDVSGGNLGRPKYWYRCPTEYWNQFYFSWLSWTEVRPRCQFVKYEDFEAHTERDVMAIAQRFGLKRKNPDAISLPRDRVGPHVPTDRAEERFLLTAEARQWIRQRVNPLVAKTFGYEL